MTRNEIYNAIDEERESQDQKHPDNKIEQMLPILGEEFGEVCELVNNSGCFNSFSMKGELVQVAAVCVRWLEMLD